MALDTMHSSLWEQRPVVSGVECSVMLTDGESPVRVRVYGSGLPTRAGPPTKAHGCNCHGARGLSAQVAAEQGQGRGPQGGGAVEADGVGERPETGGGVGPMGTGGCGVPGMEQLSCCQKRLAAAGTMMQCEVGPGRENRGAEGRACAVSLVDVAGMSSDVCMPSSPSLPSLGNDAPHRGSPSPPGENSPGTTGATGATGTGNGTAAAGSGSASGGDIIARCRGDDQMVLRSFRKADTPEGAIEVELRPPPLEPGGSALVWVEAWCGMFLSRAAPVLVTTDVELACTVQSLLEAFRKAEANNGKVRMPPLFFVLSLLCLSFSCCAVLRWSLRRGCALQAAEQCKACVECLMLSLCSI